ncbi:MAG: hypothetical protein Q4P72_02955, partial [Eubacteriales bacterium]|nr:hypothetical protein [Eubacteriales bacterium]
EATTTTTTVAAEVAAVAERTAAKDSAQSVWEAAEAKRCDFTLKASDKQRALFGKKMAELKKLIDAFDVTKIDDAAGLEALVTTMNTLIGYTNLYGTDFMPTEDVVGTPDSATEFNNLLHKLQEKLAAANELLAATEITDMKDKTFLKYFGCYTAEQIKKGVHLQNLKGLREAINEATPYVTCETEVLAPKIKYEIAALQAYLDVAGKCKPVQPADPGKFVPGKPGKAAPALPATGEVATALPLVLFASASVLTALRKKH